MSFIYHLALNNNSILSSILKDFLVSGILIDMVIFINQRSCKTKYISSTLCPTILAHSGDIVSSEFLWIAMNPVFIPDSLLFRYRFGAIFYICCTFFICFMNGASKEVFVQTLAYNAQDEKLFFQNLG